MVYLIATRAEACYFLIIMSGNFTNVKIIAIFLLNLCKNNIYMTIPIALPRITVTSVTDIKMVMTLQ